MGNFDVYERANEADGAKTAADHQSAQPYESRSEQPAKHLARRLSVHVYRVEGEPRVDESPHGERKA